MNGRCKTESRLPSLHARHSRVLCFCIVATLLFIVNFPVAFADESDERFFQGLRDRRLFSLVEEYCLEELGNATISDQQRVTLLLELSRTYVDHAQYVADDEQADLWDRGAAVIDDAVSRGPLPRGELLAVQRALVSASQCAFQRVHCDLYDSDRPARDAGLTAGRDAIDRLKRAEAALQADQSTTLTADERRRLLRNVRLQLGLVSLELAQLHPVNSPDRAESLLNAKEWLSRLDDRPSRDDAGWQARVGMAVCFRLQGDPSAARREISALMADQPSDRDVVDRLAAEHVRLLLLGNKAADAGQFFVSYRRKQKRLPGELHLLKVEALIRIRELAAEHNSKKLTDQLDVQLQNAIKHVDLEVGGYWSARCRTLLDRLKESDSLGTQVADLMQSARSKFLAGETRESARGYLQAAQLAEDTGKAKPAADFRFTAASILLKAKEYSDAISAFDLFLKKHATDQRAANADLLKAWSLGQLFYSDQSSERRHSYVAALNQHREAYAGTDGAGDATWMLGQVEEQSRQVVKALDLYLQVPADHRYGVAARLAVARVYEQIFDRLEATGTQPDVVARWQSRAARDLQTLEKQIQNDGSPLSIESGRFLLSMARVYLRFKTPDYDATDAMLERVTRAMKTERPNAAKSDNQQRLSLLADARRSRIVSLAGRKQTVEASMLLNQLAAEDTAGFLDVIDGLSKLAEQQNDILAFELGLLQIKALDLLQAKGTANVDARRLDLMRARALMTTAKYVDAIELLKKVLKQSPKDQSVLKQLAHAWEGTGKTPSLTQAVGIWKRIESMNKPGSAAWCESRYHVARLSLKLGQTDEAKKLLTVTRLLYPKLGSPEIRDRFSELSKQLENSKVGSP